MALSDAVSVDRLSSIVGYKLTGGDFSPVSPNLPQRIAVIGLGTTAKQATINVDEPKQITSLKQAGDLYGFGSPIYSALRILKPVYGGGVGSIPVVVYPQLEDGSSTASERTITVTGTATANGIHYPKVCGRTSIDGESYAINIVSGDTPTIIAEKIKDSINSVLSSPVIATSALGVVTLVSKWKDASSDYINATVFDNGLDLGVTYAYNESVNGTGNVGATPINNSLSLFGNEWNTIVVNCYDLEQETILDLLQDFNGTPDATNPTGRYASTVMKPFIALTGVNDDESMEDITDSRKNEVTIAICPAPGCLTLPLEAAANMAVLFANVLQTSPHLDVHGKSYPDLPINEENFPLSSESYDFRDDNLKKGSSTVMPVNGKFQVQDFVTTYRPDGELIPQFRYCRNLMIDFNIKFRYFLLEEINVVDHAIIDNDATVTVNKTIKPKQWIGVLNKFADDLAEIALIVEPSFMKESIQVALSDVNPDRLETFFRYKRSGFVRIASTTAEAGFNFGTNN